MFNKIAFIGAGSMSEAIIAGMINKNFITGSQIHVTNKNNQMRLVELTKRYEVHCSQDKASLVKDADIIVLSMKPYDLKEAVLSYRNLIGENQLIISVVAGISTDYIAELLGTKTPIIRAMPNTSASIGYAATAISKGKYAEEKHLLATEALFQTIGTTVITAEEDLHAVTAISGSGPAYVYYLVEAMEQAASEIGLESSIATDLITQTIIGAGEMLKHSGESAEALKKKVTSPKGTTEAGLNALMKYDFLDAVVACVKDAQARSIQLGKDAENS